MKQKYREKFGSNPKNFTTVDGETIYPVKTLLSRGKCRVGQNKGDTIFRRAKVWLVFMSMKIITISAPAVLGNTRHCLKIGKNAPILVAPEIATKNVKRNVFSTGSRFLQNTLSAVDW